MCAVPSGVTLFTEKGKFVFKNQLFILPAVKGASPVAAVDREEVEGRYIGEGDGRSASLGILTRTARELKRNG